VDFAVPALPWLGVAALALALAAAGSFRSRWISAIGAK
jgi:hypothetical protein